MDLQGAFLLLLFILVLVIALVVCGLEQQNAFTGGPRVQPGESTRAAPPSVIMGGSTADSYESSNEDGHSHAGHHEWLKSQYKKIGDANRDEFVVVSHPLSADTYTTGGAADTYTTGGAPAIVQEQRREDVETLGAADELADGLADEPAGLADEPAGVADEPAGVADEPLGVAGGGPQRLPGEPVQRHNLISQKLGPDGAHWTVEQHADSKEAEPSTSPLVARKATKTLAKKRWQLYKTWDDLKKDPGASAEYFEARTAALNNPQFDWSGVYAALLPLLSEPREYVGVVGVEADGCTLKLVASEASPDAIGEGVSSTYFAGVPTELVAKYAERPALFFFHTHPADLRASPLPSSPDLATAIYFGATARFAASVVVSRFGVLVYGLGWSGYKAINAATDWKLGLLNYTHDVVAANESVRSWNWHNLRDYTDIYAKMRMFFYAHPSPPMVAASVHPAVIHCIESEIDHAIISEYSADIARHLAGRKKKGRGRTVSSRSNKTPLWSHYTPTLTLDRDPDSVTHRNPL